MPRYRITIEYDGADFNGWQRQDNGLSVQGVIEDALFAFSQERANLFAAGRTDAGVHATAQVAHFDLAKSFGDETVRDALNFYLKPFPVVVVAASLADPDFHSRFSAIGRTYLYRILNRRPPPGLDNRRVWWVQPHLDVSAMAEGAGHLLGHHDFTTFRAKECQAKSPFKTMDALTVERRGEEIEIRAEARSFLHHQVRNMVGTLRLVGEGKWSPQQVADALEARDRRAGGPTAPAFGLYLTGVKY